MSSRSPGGLLTSIYEHRRLDSGNYFEVHSKIKIKPKRSRKTEEFLDCNDDGQFMQQQWEERRATTAKDRQSVAKAYL